MISTCLCPSKFRRWSSMTWSSKRKRSSSSARTGMLPTTGNGRRLQQNYRLLINALGPPGPPPFYGASRTAWKTNPPINWCWARTRPPCRSPTDRGVYLHWVLPPGLRHAHRPGVPEFPALPDQWLIVRFTRRGSESQTKAWFLDSGLVADQPGPANLLMAQDDEVCGAAGGKGRGARTIRSRRVSGRPNGH